MKAIMRDNTEMKDSGIDWIAYIPNNWKVNVLFQITSQVKNKNLELKEQNLLSLSYGKIKRKDINTNEGLLPASFENYNIVEKDDIVLRLTDLQNDHKSLRVGHVNERGIITSAYVTLHPNVFINSNYLYYVLHMFDLKKGFYGMGAGVRQGLTYDEVKTLKICYPSMLEQQAIANYLDDRCYKIDTIIAEAKASIEEYKELKQAVIYEAVTKGLDKNVDMKDSGMKSIGKIPSHWDIYKMNLLSNRIGDGLHGTPEYDDFGEVYFINGNNLGGENIEIKNSTKRINLNEAQKYQVNLGRNTLLISLNGTIGNVSKYNNENIILGKSAGYINLKKGVNRDFIRYYLQSPSTATLFDLERTGTTIFNLSLETLRNLKICIPPSVEQEEIVDHLNNKIKRLDTLVSEKQSLIEDLEAYKKSLIYEVVTGKRKVVA